MLIFESFKNTVLDKFLNPWFCTLIDLKVAKTHLCLCTYSGASQVAQWVKESACNAGDVRDLGLIPGSGRSPGGGHGNQLQNSCLENPTDRRARRAAVHKAAESDTSEAMMHACRHLQGHLIPRGPERQGDRRELSGDKQKPSNQTRLL